VAMPGLFAQFDFGLFIQETYFAFLLLGGLLVIMYAYRDVRLPDAGNFKNIVLVLFLMTVANGMERCARVSADGRELRFAMSVVHYCLQPCVIWLELVIIMPEAVKRRRLSMLLLSLLRCCPHSDYLRQLLQQNHRIRCLSHTLMWQHIPLKAALLYCYRNR
jgi:hypothetical protein